MNQYVEMKRRQRQEYEKFLVSDLGEEPDRLYCVAPNTYIRKGDFMEFQDMLDRFAQEREDAVAADLDGNGFIFEMFVYELTAHGYASRRKVEDTLEALGYTSQEVSGDEHMHHGLMKAAKYVLKKRPARNL